METLCPSVFVFIFQTLEWMDLIKIWYGLSTLNLVRGSSITLNYLTFESKVGNFFKERNDVCNTERKTICNRPDKFRSSRPTCYPRRH
jgi:hypothetical protein